MNTILCKRGTSSRGDQIQGNILAGSNKDFQTLIFLHIDRARYFKQWLASQVDFIATTAEILAFNRLFKEIRTRRKRETNAVKATWINIAFSYEGIRKRSAPLKQVSSRIRPSKPVWQPVQRA